MLIKFCFSKLSLPVVRKHSSPTILNQLFG